MPRKRTKAPSVPELVPSVVEFNRAVPPVRRAPIALARRFCQICTTAIGQEVAREDLNTLQYAVLAYINRFNGEPDIDQNGLAARLGVDRSHVSLLIEQLGGKGLIEQRVNGADRRARLLRLTSKGEKLYRKLMPPTLAAQQQILSGLSSAEREHLLDLLVRVIEQNRALARPWGGRRKRGSRQTAANKSRPSPSNKT